MVVLGWWWYRETVTVQPFVKARKACLAHISWPRKHAVLVKNDQSKEEGVQFLFIVKQLKYWWRKVEGIKVSKTQMVNRMKTFAVRWNVEGSEQIYSGLTRFWSRFGFSKPSPAPWFRKVLYRKFDARGRVLRLRKAITCFQTTNKKSCWWHYGSRLWLSGNT